MIRIRRRRVVYEMASEHDGNGREGGYLSVWVCMGVYGGVSGRRRK